MPQLLLAPAKKRENYRLVPGGLKLSHCPQIINTTLPSRKDWPLLRGDGTGLTNGRDTTQLLLSPFF